MKQFRITLGSLCVSILLLAVVAIPASARQGSDDSTEGTTGTETAQIENETNISSDGSSTSGSVSRQGRSERIKRLSQAKLENETEDEAKDVAEMKLKGQAFLAEVAKGKKQGLTTEQRQKVCEAKKTNLQIKVDRIASKASAQQARYDSVLAKAASYKTTNNLTVADWDSLYATALAKQATSAASVNALTAAKPTIDCTSTELVTNLATFKVATKQAKQDLAAYRQSVKLLLAKLEVAKTDTTTAGAQQ